MGGGVVDFCVRGVVCPRVDGVAENLEPNITDDIVVGGSGCAVVVGV